MAKTELTSGAPAPIASFGSLLRRYRDAAELTQEELAERAGLSVRGISDLERGVKLRPQRTTIRLLAEGLGLTDTELVALEAAVPSRHRRVAEGLRLLDLPVGGFLGAAPDNRLVARAREIARARELVDIVRGGDGRLLLLSGEPGVGKTRLAQEVTLICRAGGMYLTTGRCYEPQRNVPFAPFLEPLTRLVTVAEDRLSLDPLQRWPQLARLVPSHPLPPPDDEGAQQRLFWAVTGLLEALAEHTPITIGLDDLHWADRSSLLLLQHLAPQLRHVPVLLLGTYRDVEVEPDGPLARLLRDLHRERLAEEIDIRRLSHDETRELIASTLGAGEIAADFAHVVHRHTEGNAFFVQEVARALTERGEVVERGGVWEYRASSEIAIPHTVQEAIRERLNRLSKPAQALLEEASVLGQTFTFDELQDMAGKPEEAIEEYLSEATRASVVRTGEQESYTFNHALTQQVLYRELRPRQRRRLHRAAGTAIEQQPRHLRDLRAAELAWHFRQGGNPVRTVRYTILAGRQAEVRYAHQEAEQHYRAALELAHQTGDTVQEAESLEVLGRVLTDVGRFDEARTALEQAASMYRQEANREGEARVVVQLGSVHTALGTVDVGIDQVQNLLERLELGGRQQDIAELYIVLETLLWAAGRPEQGLTAAERAVELTKDTKDVGALARAETGRGVELLELQRLDEALHVLESAIALCEQVDDPANLARALDVAAWGFLYRGHPGRSLEIMERSLALQERSHNPWGIGIALSIMGVVYRVLGNWTEARKSLERGVTVFRTLPPSSWAVSLLLELAELSLNEGKLTEGAALLDEALGIARLGAPLVVVGDVERLLAERELAEGRPELARHRLEALCKAEHPRELQVTEVLPTLAEACEASGDARRAEEIVQEAIRRAKNCNYILVLARALLIRGRLTAMRADWPAAQRDLEASVRLARAMPHPLLEGRGLFELGSTLGKKGELAEARQLLEEALAIFEQLGAVPDADRTERAMSALAI